MVVSTETISTQNMTGFLTRVRGSSFLNEAQIAGTISERSNNDIGRRLRLASPLGGRPMIGVMIGHLGVPWDFSGLRPGEELALVHRDLLGHRPQRDRREIGQAADDQDDADQQPDK